MTAPRRRRRRRAPVPAGAMLGRWRRRAEGARDEVLEAVLDAWPGAVGDAVTARARPVRRSRAGLVTVACADAVWAQELAAQAEDIAARLADALPEAEIRGLRFVADEHALRESSAPEADSRPARPVPGPAEVAAAERLVGDVGDPALRALLARAAAASARPERGGETPPEGASQRGRGRAG
jgi:hypothetical protein